MENITNNIKSFVKESYIFLVIALLGIVSFVSAVLISWPALAYIGSKLFM